MSEIATIGCARRRRLPNRRPAATETIRFLRGDGQPVSYDASVGFDELGRPKEIFLSGAKEGSDMAAALADTAVLISVALQHGVSAAAMALSVARVSVAPGSEETMPGSIVGGALDLLLEYEREEPDQGEDQAG